MNTKFDRNDPNEKYNPDSHYGLGFQMNTAERGHHFKTAVQMNTAERGHHFKTAAMCGQPTFWLFRWWQSSPSLC
jgi:hypothetical protein